TASGTSRFAPVPHVERYIDAAADKDMAHAKAQRRKGKKFLCASAPLREISLSSLSFNWGIDMTHNEISRIVVDVAIDIHRKLGPGLLESVYLVVLAHELRKRGLQVEKEVPIPVRWDNIGVEAGSRADVIIE